MRAARFVAVQNSWCPSVQLWILPLERGAVTFRCPRNCLFTIFDTHISAEISFLRFTTSETFTDQFTDASEKCWKPETLFYKDPESCAFSFFVLTVFTFGTIWERDALRCTEEHSGKTFLQTATQNGAVPSCVHQEYRQMPPRSVRGIRICAR